MRLLVLLESSADVRISPRRDRRTGRLRPEWQVRRLDPSAVRALDLALEAKTARPGTYVVVALLGPEEDEDFLRQVLARGADAVVRIWDDECRDLRTPGKALVLAAAARAAQPDLVLAGAASAATSSGQLGVLVAAHLGTTCVTQVVGLDLPSAAVADTDPDTGADASRGADVSRVRITRGLAGGFQEIVEVLPPAVVTSVPAEPDTTAPPLPALLAAHTRPIDVWDLSELGVPREAVRRADGSIRYGRLKIPRPVVRRLPAPDSTAPAFERIGELVRGTVRRRDGHVSDRPVDELVEELFLRLRDAGWLEHLRREAAE